MNEELSRLFLAKKLTCTIYPVKLLNFVLIVGKLVKL